MRIMILLMMTILSVTSYGQSTYYATIPAFPETYSAGSVAARTIDGLGFRYYWATDGLRETDLAHQPSAGGRTCQETLEHIYEMSFLIANATINKVNVAGQDVKLPFADMRKKTLDNFKAASDVLRKATDGDMKNLKILFSDGKETYEFPFCNLINGPIEDCIWHTGQIVSFRRTSGNPIAEKDFFTGK